MTAGLGIRPAARSAWQRLHAALLNLDQPTPCQSAPDVWTSDDADQRAIASRACTDCAVILQCAAFARINRETANVWAGIDRTPQRGRPAAPRKEATCTDA